MNEQQIYFDLMMRIVKEAGKIASELICQSDPAFKADKSVITEADRKISKLTHDLLGDLLKKEDHLLIDEEDTAHLKYFDEKILSKKYIWSIDPIDGTRPYANTMPFYGISLGLIKDRRPWMGAVYFPSLRELFYCDGERAFFTSEPFTDKETKQEIVPIDQQITSQSIFLCSDAFYKFYDWHSTDCHVIIPACAAVDLCWPTIGRGCGSMFRAHIWDFAGSWPIYEKAGLKLRSLANGKMLDRFDLDFFQTENRPWKVKEFFILSSERNYPILKDKLRPRRL